MALRFNDRVRHAVRYGLLRRLPSCKDFVPVMSQTLDRTLTLRERALLRLHLLTCVWCDLYLAQLRFMRATLRARAAHLADDTITNDSALSFAARTRLKSALRPPEH